MIGSKALASKVAKGAVIGALGIAALGVVAPSAFASGTSGNTNGCYSTWGSTGSDAHCHSPGAQKAGNYQNYGSCWNSGDQSFTYTGVYVGWIDPDWGQVDCVFSINCSRVNYLG